MRKHTKLFELPNITELEPNIDTSNEDDITEEPYDNPEDNVEETTNPGSIGSHKRYSIDQFSDDICPECGQVDCICDECSDVVEEDYYPDEDYNNTWTEIDSKQVLDSDGFYTDYTMYTNDSRDRWIFMFGDKDINEPDPEYADWKTDDEDSAYEWFDNYNGFEDDITEEPYDNLE